MAEVFKCPSCSAPLEFEGKMMQKCKFCQSNVVVPSEMMRNSNAFGGAGALDFGDLSALKGKALQIAEIQKLIQSGQKIYAIKLFRETFGVGLKEAKDAVDAMEEGKSIDISGMKIQTANLRANPTVIKIPKSVGAVVGGSILASFIIPAIFVVGVLGIIFYFVWTSMNRAVEQFTPLQEVTNNQIPQNRTQEVASIAQEILKFGGEGIGAGKFRDNRTIATDTQGRIFSAEFSGSIQVFDANGNFLTQIIVDTTNPFADLATDRKGNLFVLENYNLHRFKIENGENLGKTRIDNALDLAIGLDGKIYISTQNGEIQVFDAEGVKLNTIQLGKQFNLKDISEIAIDGAGNFVALDGATSVIYKFTPNGKVLTRFGGKNHKSASMFAGIPYDLAVDSQGRIYASQVSRISIFDANGNYLTDFKTTQAFGMVFNDKDELFVASRPFVVKYKLNF